MNTPRLDRRLFLDAWTWTAQFLLAAFYCILGAAKMLAPIPDLSLWVMWTSDHPVLARITGFLDFLGGVGILAPALFLGSPPLTALAALGLSLLQVAAIGFHVWRLEPSYLPLNFLALALSLFVLWRRWPL